MSLDGRSPEAGAEARRNRRIRTVDYSKPGADAPFAVPTMSGMAGRSAPLAFGPTLPLSLPCLCPHPALALTLPLPLLSPCLAPHPAFAPTQPLPLHTALLFAPTCGVGRFEQLTKVFPRPDGVSNASKQISVHAWMNMMASQMVVLTDC